MNEYNYFLDFSHGEDRQFPFRGHLYLIRHSPVGWAVERFCSRHDTGTSEIISEYFQSPDDLVKTARIDDITIEDIFRYHEYDMHHFFRYEYNYGKFLTDIRQRIEYEFSFRNHEYFIDYWGQDPRATWIPGWIFSNDNGRTLAINEKEFETFVGKVNRWMVDNEGVTLEDMFNTFYKSDNTGDLQLVCINGTGHQGLADDE